jgi:hypothetical protein
VNNSDIYQVSDHSPESMPDATIERKLAQILSIDDLAPYAYAGQQSYAPTENSIWDGGKFAGGFGRTCMRVASSAG